MCDSMPLSRSTEEQRSHFIKHEWDPFISGLRDALITSQTRYLLGFSPEEVLPSRESWIDWAQQCRDLTARWHGRPNVSVIYELLLECSYFDGITAYRFTELRQEWSADGWVRLVDGKTRKDFYKKANELKAMQTPAVSQKAGESMIDNTVLPNVMTAAESHVLLAGRLIKNFAVRWHAKRQRKCLANLAKLPSMPTNALGSLPPDQLRAALQSLKDEEVLSVGVDPDSSALQTLRRSGLIVSSSGQFTTEMRVQMQQFLEKSFVADAPTDTHTELDEFVSFIRAHPGCVYQGDSLRHHFLLQCVLLSKDYVVVKRSTMAEFTGHCYFANRWERTCPLVEFDEKGGEKEIRPAGTEEFSRFRKNDFPYQDSHGMSISTGGLAEDSLKPKDVIGHGLAYDLGVALPQDGEAKVGNWFASDFEKTLNEVAALNPAGGIKDLLSGESFHEVCQNPRVSSSIRETQHVQISRGSASMWPVMRLEQKPAHIHSLGGTLDVVQIGSEADAFQVCIESQDIASPAIISFFQELRLLLYRKCGPAIDFILLTSPRGDGWIRASFAALGDIAVVEGEFRNRLLDEGNSDYKVPWGVVVDSTAGKGNYPVFSPEGWAAGLEGASGLRRLYDFCRFPGTRAIVADHLKNLFSYIDDVPGACLTVAKPLVPNGGLSSSLFESIVPSQE